MQLVSLGTGASWATAERNTAAIALGLGESTALFDCWVRARAASGRAEDPR